VQLEIREIHSVATQGFTKPLHCKLSNEKNYYVKGKRATAAGLIKEWMAANLAHAMNLPIPNFCIAYADKRLIDIFDKDFGHGEVFASECIEFADEFNYQSPIDSTL
jgi:putative sterol carrier protein